VTGDSQNSLDLPAPDRTTSPINTPLMMTSLVLLGGTYGASAIDAPVSNRDADKKRVHFAQTLNALSWLCSFCARCAPIRGACLLAAFKAAVGLPSRA
jgi:hypothetical protein